MKKIRRTLCLLRGHTRPKYEIENFEVVGRCRCCGKILLINDKGSLLE